VWIGHPDKHWCLHKLWRAERGVHLLLPQQLPPIRRKPRSVAVPATGTSELAEALGIIAASWRTKLSAPETGALRTPAHESRCGVKAGVHAASALERRDRFGDSDAPAFRTRNQAEARADNSWMHGTRTMAASCERSRDPSEPDKLRRNWSVLLAPRKCTCRRPAGPSPHLLGSERLRSFLELPAGRCSQS